MTTCLLTAELEGGNLARFIDVLLDGRSVQGWSAVGRLSGVAGKNVNHGG